MIKQERSKKINLFALSKLPYIKRKQLVFRSTWYIRYAMRYFRHTIRNTRYTSWYIRHTTWHFRYTMRNIRYTSWYHFCPSFQYSFTYYMYKPKDKLVRLSNIWKFFQPQYINADRNKLSVIS